MVLRLCDWHCTELKFDSCSTCSLIPQTITAPLVDRRVLNQRHFKRHHQNRFENIITTLIINHAATANMAVVMQRAPPTTAIPTRTLTSGTRKVQYMVMTSQALLCPPPVLTDDFDYCQIPGGLSLWAQGGFYSPGVCFIGYEAQCTQTDEKRLAWPIRPGETVVRCIPS